MIDHQQRALELKQLLSKAVAEALDKKRRLGQYAVIARDGKPVRVIPGESPTKEPVK